MDLLNIVYNVKMDIFQIYYKLIVYKLQQFQIVKLLLVLNVQNV